MLTVAISKRNKLQNIIVLTPKDGFSIQYSLIAFKAVSLRIDCFFLTKISDWSDEMVSVRAVQ